MLLNSNNVIALADTEAWRDTTESLYKYLRRDHSDLTDQLRAIFPKTWDDRIERPVPFIWRLARELASLYRKPATRTHIGSGITRDVQARIDSIYRAIEVDTRLQAAQEQLVVLNNAALWALPSPQGVRLVVVPPHHQMFWRSDPMSLDDRDIEKAHVKLPLGHDPETGLVAFGLAEITRDSAIWIEAPDSLRGTGVFSEDGANPLGLVPVIIWRGSEPAPGEFWAPAPEDLLAMQRAISLSQTDLGHISMLQGYGQPVITGISASAAKEVRLGPESIVGLPDETQKFSFEHGSPPIADYQRAVEGYTSQCLAMLGIRPEVFLRTGAVSAIAKQVDLIDREIEREKFKIIFQKAEQRLYDLVRLWINHLRGTSEGVYPEAMNVEVRFHEPEKPADPLHNAQSTAMLVDMGLTTASRELARTEGISQVEAVVRVETNLKETRRMKRIVTPDGQVVQGQAPLRVADDG